MTSLISTFCGIFDSNLWQRVEHMPLYCADEWNFAFAKIVQSGTEFSMAVDGSTIKMMGELVARVRVWHLSAPLLMTLGGDGDSSSFGGAAQDPNFPLKVQRFLETHGLQGINFDWENGTNAALLDQLTQGTQELRRKGYTVTLNGWQDSSWGDYDLLTLNQTLDRLYVMTYGASMGTAETQASLASYTSRGFDLSKLMVGVETESTYTQGGGVDTLGFSGTIAQKVHVALQGAAGVFSWRIDNDYCQPEAPTIPTYQGALEVYEAMQGKYAAAFL